jgi:molybdenum cofactor synthesis domain-containing protein
MTESFSNPTAAVLIIGNEILSGRTQDANLNYIAAKLTGIGIPLGEARVVRDIENEIIEAVNALRARYTYVFTTGGIGPTHDDITAECIAKAFGVKLIDHPEATALLRDYYKDKINDARMRMARIPEGATLISNPVSTAPGFSIGNVYVMAGVPNIMQAMLDGVLATLKHGPAIHSMTVSGYVAESLIAAELAAVAKKYPQLDIGSYPWLKNARYGTALVTRGTDQATVKAASQEIYKFVLPHDPAATIE